MEGFIDTLNGLIWSNWLVFLCLGAGAYFTLVTLFLQIRCPVSYTHLTLPTIYSV